MKAQGTNGEIELTEQMLVIRKRGLSTLILQGAKGEKRIPYSSISAIQLRKPGLVTVGYFQLTLAGGVESRGGVFDATKDENTVLFNKGQFAVFQQLQAAVEAHIAAARHVPAARSIESGPLDMLKKLGELHEAGVLSVAEFEAKKADLLGRI